jgi:hypothetical protein
MRSILLSLALVLAVSACAARATVPEAPAGLASMATPNGSGGVWIGLAARPMPPASAWAAVGHDAPAGRSWER